MCCRYDIFLCASRVIDIFYRCILHVHVHLVSLGWYYKMVYDLLYLNLEFSKTAHLLADGNNHTSCCRNKDVPPTCLSFCGGSIPALEAGHLVCLQHINTILTCMQQGNGERICHCWVFNERFFESDIYSVHGCCNFFFSPL